MSPAADRREISDRFAPPELRTPHRAPEALARLGRAARHGLLPGFQPRGERAFRVEADAVPFGYEMLGTIEDAGEGSVVRLAFRRMRRMPLIFAIVIAFTIWPGVWLTDSLMATYWSAYGRWSVEMPWLTYAWYMPITVLPLPWMWASMARKSRAEAVDSAKKQVAALTDALDAARA